MPDFERPLQSLRLHACQDETERSRLQAYFKGVSQGRKEAAIVAAILGLAYLLIQVLSHLQPA